MTFFLKVLEIFTLLDDILHVGHMEEVDCLERTLHWRRSAWHSMGGH